MDLNDLTSIKKLLLSDMVSNYERRVIIYTLLGTDNNSKEQISKSSMLNDLKKILSRMQELEPTPIIKQRKKEINTILEKISQSDLPDEDLIEISFIIDCLFYDSDLKPRNTQPIRILSIKGKKGENHNERINWKSTGG